jgi:hypothetical protein
LVEMAKNITTRRKLLGKGVKTTAKVAVGSGLAVGAGLGILALHKRRARAREERRAGIRQRIASSRLSIDPGKWMPFFEIYKFNLGKKGARNFVDGVNLFCAEKKMSLRTFFFTLETHRLDPYHIAQQRKSVQGVLNFCLENHLAEATRAKKVLGSLARVRALPEEKI